MKLNRTTTDNRPSGEGESVYCVLGGGHLGAAVARRLRADGHEVSVVDESYDPSVTSGVQGDPADIRALDEAGIPAAATVVVATQSDSRNLLIAQLIRSRFDVRDVVVLANAPDRIDLFTDAGHEPVCATSALSDTLVDSI